MSFRESITFQENQVNRIFICPIDNSEYDLDEIDELVQSKGYAECSICIENDRLTLFGQNPLHNFGPDEILVIDNPTSREEYYSALSTLTKISKFEDSFLEDAESALFKEFSLFDIRKDNILIKREDNELIGYITSSRLFDHQNRFTRKAYQNARKEYQVLGVELLNLRIGQIYVVPWSRSNGFAKRMIRKFINRNNIKDSNAFYVEHMNSSSTSLFNNIEYFKIAQDHQYSILSHK
ncbi:MAG: hypothetical protein INQ03_20345 [Candidatus Heimdallarchaeota archaeon]|nr:hypothetical protein [Candidatus Heimdallarchaeota archaeon]